MESVFIRLLNVSISAGFLVLATLFIRLLFRRAPKWLFTTLWCLLGIRLIFPIDYESIFSLIPSKATVSEGITHERYPMIDTGIHVINDAINPTISSTLAPTPQVSINPMQTVFAIATVVWLTGLILMILYMISSYVILKLKLREAIHIDDGLYESDNVDMPFVIGFFKPRIYISSFMNKDDTDTVLLHERAHIERLDHIVKPIAFVLLAVYWFNPLIWLGYILFSRDIELACDERVTKNMNAAERADYSAVLLRYGCKPSIKMISPIAFGEVGVGERIRAISKYKKPGVFISVICIFIIAACVLCFLTYKKSTDNSINEGIYTARCISYRDPFSSYIGTVDDMPVTVIREDGSVLVRTEDLSGLSYNPKGNLYTVYVSDSEYKTLFASDAGFRDGIDTESFAQSVYNVYSVESILSDADIKEYVFNTSTGIYYAIIQGGRVWSMYQLEYSESIPKYMYVSTYYGSESENYLTVDTEKRTMKLHLDSGSSYSPFGSFTLDQNRITLITDDTFGFKLTFIDTGTMLIYSESESDLKSHTLPIKDGDSFLKSYMSARVPSYAQYYDINTDGEMELIFVSLTDTGISYSIIKNGSVTESGNLEFTKYELVTLTALDGALYLIGEYRDTDLSKYYYRITYSENGLSYVAEGVRS